MPNDLLKTRAVAFAARMGHSDEMAHAFLERLCAMGLLGTREQYGPVLYGLMREERKDKD